MTRIIGLLLAIAALAVPAAAHHGWGSYDSANPVTVTGPITYSKYENPHATIKVKGKDKEWTVTLAPTFRMTNRGALVDMIAVGKSATAYGYPSTVEKDEMRAERITVAGKTIELR